MTIYTMTILKYNWPKMKATFEAKVTRFLFFFKQIYISLLRTGTLTDLQSTHGIIDGTLYFNMDNVKPAIKHDLEIRCSIQYIGERIDANHPVRIIRVIGAERLFDPQEEIDQLRFERNEYFGTVDRKKLVIVLQRNGSNVVCDDDIAFNLNEVSPNFVPIVGDSLLLDTKVEKTDKFCDGGVGEFVEVTAVREALKCDGRGRITHVDKQRRWGAIDDKYFFRFDELDSNSMHPQLNDLVGFEAIETVETMNRYTWRCLKVSIIDEVTIDENGKQRTMHCSNKVFSSTGRPTKEAAKRNASTAQTLRLMSRRGDVVAGISNAPKANFVYRKFKDFRVPDALNQMVLSTKDEAEIDDQLDIVCPFFTETLSFKTYQKYFHYLIYLEEIYLNFMMRRYDQDRAHFVRQGEYLALRMDNILESRPSLVIGDYVCATPVWKTTPDADNKIIQGCINKVLSDRLLLKFDASFHDRYNGEDWKLDFHFSRKSITKQHFAIDEVALHMGQEFLFPDRVVNKPVQVNVELNDDAKLKWFNASLNDIQKMAIVNIVRGEARPMPYILFGPPGTGKTVTMIETILQIYTNIPDSRIVVATPSNSASDLITERLIGSGIFVPGEFVRLVSYNAVEREQVPVQLMPYCATCDIARVGTTQTEMSEGRFGIRLRCNADVLARHRIIIGTCTTLGTLLQMKFPADHFTHVLIDEAGQCVEPDALIPVSLLSKRRGQVILAGDPMQLAPVVFSQLAKSRGMDESLLVRLLDRAPYKKDPEVIY